MKAKTGGIYSQQFGRKSESNSTLLITCVRAIKEHNVLHRCPKYENEIAKRIINSFLRWQQGQRRGRTTRVITAVKI